MNEEHRDALARVIDPDAWDLYDDPRMKVGSARIAIVKESREVAQRIVDSGLMAAMEWDRKEFIRARDRIAEGTSRTGRCYSVEDGMDGYVMHDPKCPLWPKSWLGSSKDCLK